MDNQIFRKKSLDRISSPEQLNDYLRVSNPKVWMMIAAIFVLLIGACIWGFFGHMDSTITVCVSSGESGAICYLPEARIEEIEPGMALRINDEEYALGAIETTPEAADSAMDAYMLHIGALQAEDWVYAAGVDGEIPQGVYAAQLVLESVSPMSFILN